jgi:hypothetical protein
LDNWARVIGDTVFAVSEIMPGWFVPGLKTGWSLKPQSLPEER